MNGFSKENDYGVEKAIVGAIAFFDMFDCPLTDFEIWKYASVKSELSAVRRVLENLTGAGGVVERANGFYFLKGRSGIVKTRLKRYVYADRKFKRAMRVVRIFKLIPWIKTIAVSNVIGAHNLKDGSDIDLFIIAGKKKIWLTRFFCAALAQIAGLRPEEGNTRDKICLNFYASEEAMDMRPLLLGGSSSESAAENSAQAGRKINSDIYFTYWLANLVPIYEVDGMYKKFVRENDWMRDCLPNWRPPQTERRRCVRGRKAKFNLLNLFNGFENLFKKLQFKLMSDDLKKLMNKDTRVVINDKVLKLHINDRRGEYKKNYELRIKNYE